MNKLLFAFLFAATCSLIGCRPAVVNTEVQKSTNGDSTDDVDDEYPLFTWKLTNVTSGNSVSVSIVATDFVVVEERMRQIDWSKDASEQPSMVVELDRINSLTIEIDAAAQSNEHSMIAIWRQASEAKGATTAVLVKRSKPLKDAKHALTLFRAHFGGDPQFESLAEWEIP